MEWKYTENIEEARRKSLTFCDSFDELVSLVSEDISNVTVKVKPGKDTSLISCVQPIFTFELPKFGDAIFNGPYGYRAQYFLSPCNGLEANCKLINALSSKLLGAVTTSTEEKLCRISVPNSLFAASAKFWFNESPDFLHNLSVDLDIERWAKEAEKGCELAKWGLCAPKVTTFEIKGALIDPNGNEVVPNGKILRHHQIHNFGFT